MVVPARQVAQFPLEPFVAGVVLAGRAIAVAAPVADRLDQSLQVAAIGPDGAALAHGDVVGGIEADRANVAEGADQLAVIARAEGVAAVLDHIEIMLLRHPHDLAEVERIAEGVGQNDGPGLVGHRRLDPGRVDIVGRQVDIDEDGHKAVLDGGIDRRREAGRAGDDLVAGLQRPVPQHRRTQGRGRREVGRRAGVDGQGEPDADILRQPGLERGVEPAGRQPQVE